MARPIILGVVGDSAAGKTTITRGLVRILGEDQVTHVCTDDYHRYDRQQRAERGITPLNPECNYLDIVDQHLAHLRQGNAILKPVYRHADGTIGSPEYVKPNAFTVVEGLLGFHTESMRARYDVRVYLAPPENLRRQWKVQRDCSRRGYTTDQVLAELDRRESDSAAFIRPQERWADIVLSFQPSERGTDADHLDANLLLRETLPHPDLEPFIGNGDRGIAVSERGSECLVQIPGNIDAERASEIEEAIWEKMRFATHLRSLRLGEFTVGVDLHRSESLALAQLIILYHMVLARVTISLGGDSPREQHAARNADERRVSDDGGAETAAFASLSDGLTSDAAVAVGRGGDGARGS
jgi:phosphoribulokinase